MHNPTVAHRWAETFLRQLKALGVERICLAPGSRSTVLAMQASRIFDDAVTVHFDERGLGFFAVGASKLSHKPTCLITTSGTAVANLLPAVVEAKLGHVPLIVISADRPPELRDRGSNQTIDQNTIFGSHAQWYFDIPCATDDISLDVVREWAFQAWERSLYGGAAGPVHINWMFREPFFTDPSCVIESAAELPVLRRSHARRRHSVDLHELERTLARSARGVCVLGELTNEGDVQAVTEFAQRLGWVTIADPLSQLRTSQAIPTLLSYGDLILLKEIPNEHRPDTILHIGGRIVSKRVSHFLAAHPGAEVVQISACDDFRNPHISVQDRYVTDLADLAGLKNIGPQQQSQAFVSFCNERNRVVAKVLEDVCAPGEGDVADEPRLLRLLAGLVPSDHVLTVGNSMPIRDFDMFAPPRASAPWLIANRGASGIDGVVATGIGAALASKRDGTIIVGDLSMLHDLNSLALVRDCSQSIVVVVINNDGGGIFSMLPVAASECFEKAFATPHGREFSQLAAGFSMRYAKPTNIGECMRFYRDAINHRGATLLEVVTNREANAALHRDLHARISKALC